MNQLRSHIMKMTVFFFLLSNGKKLVKLRKTTKKLSGVSNRFSQIPLSQHVDIGIVKD